MEYCGLRFRTMIKRGTPGALTADDRMQLQYLQVWLVSEQKERLRCGVQLARAFRPQSPTPLAVEDVPPEWWELVRVDLDANTAEANGTRLTGILVYPGIDDRRMQRPASKPVLLTAPRRRRWPLACRRRNGAGKGQETERVKREMLADIDSKKHTLEVSMV